MRKGAFTAALVFGLAGWSWGHLNNLRMNGTVVATPSSSVPQDDPYSVGTTVTLAYNVDINHAGTSIHVQYSSNGGTSWTTVNTIPSSSGAKTYQWTVTGPPTTQGKIRIHQTQQAASNTSNDYNLVSGAFPVEAGTPILPFAVDAPGIHSVIEFKGALQVQYQGGEFRHAEISNLNGLVLRSFALPSTGGRRDIVLSTAGLPMGKAVLRLVAEGKPASNRMVLIRR
jgi:hypothetical protein